MRHVSRTDKNKSNLLSLPVNVGRVIVEAAAVLACPLLGTDSFIDHCCKRGLSIDRERLLRFERLGLFSPVFRVRTPDEDTEQFNIPIRANNNWFEKGWAWDTTSIPASHEIPEITDRSQEGYYSIFQIEYLDIVTREMTIHVQLDSYLEGDGAIELLRERSVTRWLEDGAVLAEGLRHHEYRRSIGMLCQYISNRYYPKALGDQRTVRIERGGFVDAWISVNGYKWDWEEEARAWDAKKVEALFDLTPEKLRHAYRTLAGSQASADPLENWYQLIQFISIDERKRLNGEALKAETLREGALMLRWLYQDLYGEELPPPNEIYRTVMIHMPELEVRKDVRRHLEYVVNKYGLNPQPKLVFIVEGKTEERIINRIFEEGFGFTLGACWIELLVIGGVGNATGNWKNDRFRAILRLIDYLHHHQTLVYVLLDNENYSSRLRKEAGKAASIHGHRRRITRVEYIHIWKSSLEFDNFSDTEIASALTEVANGAYKFVVKDIATCRRAKQPGACLATLYKEMTRHDIPKPKLGDALFNRMQSPASRRAAAGRPIVRVLHQVAELAMKNPFPVMQEIWAKNQASKMLAKKR